MGRWEEEGRGKEEQEGGGEKKGRAGGREGERRGELGRAGGREGERRGRRERREERGEKGRGCNNSSPGSVHPIPQPSHALKPPLLPPSIATSCTHFLWPPSHSHDGGE